MPSQTQLEYLIAVSKLKHFGQAAEHCHVSQPSLSMQIQKVEEELGFKIFDRNSKPVSTTPKGQLVIEQAQNIISEYNRLMQISREETLEIKGPFHLGVIPTLSSTVIPLFVKAFSHKYPKVDLYISELTTESILQQLKLGELDAGLLATPLSSSSLEKRILFYEGFAIFCSPQHPLLKKRNLKLKDITQHSDLWILSDGHCFKNQVLNFCGLNNDLNVFNSIHFQSGSLETLKELVLSGSGYTFLPQLSIDKLKSAEKRLVRPLVAPLPSREISLVHNKAHWKSDILKALENLIVLNLPNTVAKQKNKKFEVLAADS